MEYMESGLRKIKLVTKKESLVFTVHLLAIVNECEKIEIERSFPGEFDVTGYVIDENFK